MPWFKVDDSFSSHPKVLSIPRGTARLRAVGLWTSLGSWCARQLTDGRFASHMVEEHGGTKVDARHLVNVGLWEVIEGGYQFHDWHDWQPSRAKVEKDRAEARERMAAHRARKKGKRSDGVRANTSRTSGEVTPTPTRPDPTHAAAAASNNPEPLPPPLVILKDRLDAAKMTVRWDRLTADQYTEIEQLIEIHGDAALVRSAVAQFRPDAPASFAQAWLPGWRALAAPGAGLRAVDDPPCPEPGHSGTTRHCVQCASERIQRKAD